MGRLKEFVRKEADHLKGEAQKREITLKEWQESIERLYAQLIGWIEEADGGLKLLRTNQSAVVTCREPTLGPYELPSLVISLGQYGSRGATVVPRARHVAAQVKWEGTLRRADGMLEIRDQAMSVHYIFRLIAAEGDKWFIRSVAEWNADPEYGNAFPLDQERFEAAILSILK